MPKAHDLETEKSASDTAGAGFDTEAPSTFHHSDGRPAPSTVHDPEHDRQLVWYRLMKTSNLLTRPFFARFAEQYDLSLTDWRVVKALADRGPAAAHEICDDLGMHPMNISRSVANLRKQGRITEHRDPENRRRKILTLTADGWALYHKLTPQVDKIADFLFGSMSHLEVEFLSKLLHTLIGRLESVDPESPLLIEPSALADDEGDTGQLGSRDRIVGD